MSNDLCFVMVIVFLLVQFILALIFLMLITMRIQSKLQDVEQKMAKQQDNNREMENFKSRLSAIENAHECEDDEPNRLLDEDEQKHREKMERLDEELEETVIEYLRCKQAEKWTRGHPDICLPDSIGDYGVWRFNAWIRFQLLTKRRFGNMDPKRLFKQIKNQILG